MSTQVLNAETFSQPGIAASAATGEMSYGGVIAKSLFLLVLTFACAVVGWDLAACRDLLCAAERQSLVK